MAAGQGFKTFTTGEVLSAADVNGYLMQGVLVFASAAARDAAITSPQEGQFAYLKDTNVTTYYTGSAWANVDSTGMTNPMTTTGDTIYSSSGSTPARLGVGTTGQVLTVSGGVPSWSTPAGGGSLTLLSTTTLSGSSTTVSSISQSYKNLYVEVANVAGIDSFVRFQPNGNNMSDLIFVSTSTASTPSNAGSIMGNSSGPGPTLFTATIFNYAATTEQKNVQYATNGGASVFGAGFVKSNTAISSIAISVGSGTFSGGTLRIYGVN